MIFAAAAALIALPFITFRGALLRNYLAADLAGWIAAWLLWRHELTAEPWVFCTAVAVCKLSIFSVALARGSEVRWSAARAAAVAGLIYFAAIPAMLRTPIDGDEPYYLLITESIVQDFDLDLANQYRHIDRTASGRRDLGPQFGDPVGPEGERYSRHEPFLSLLLVPGYLIGGLHGAVATICIFGMLLVRSTVRWMEDEGIEDRIVRAVFPFFALGPPVLFYAGRLWPEVPAAFFFVEALRGIGEHRTKRWLPALAGLVLLKLRFVLVAGGVVAVLMLRQKRISRRAVLALLVAAVPLGVMWLVSGSPTSVHSWREILPAPGERYLRGLFGVLADGMGGLAFQAPFYLSGLFALVRWKSTTAGFRNGMLAAAIYVFYLLPRPEWYGGWAPPLRYLVFLMPVLALGAAAVWDRLSRGALAVIALWTAGLVIHGLPHPWRLFHIADGQNVLGEALSKIYHADFGRIFPSFIRPNGAEWIGVAVVVFLVVIGLHRLPRRLGAAAELIPVAVFSIAIGAGFVHALRPAERVEFEDAHVVQDGGHLHPELYAMMRWAHRGGWVLEEGDSMTFLAEAGRWQLEYIAGIPAVIEIGGTRYDLPADGVYRSAFVTVPVTGHVTLRCVRGAVNLDRMVHD
jgi:hypothetical protein